MENQTLICTICASKMENQTPLCKICASSTALKFSIPSTKLTGHPIPDLENDCYYYECKSCNFLFSNFHDKLDHTKLYDENYWDNQDPDWGGRVNQTLRLVLMAGKLLDKNPWEYRVLDYGCGMGTFVEASRTQLQMQTWGTDIIKPKFGLNWFVPKPEKKMFDIVVACEVIEHLPDPIGIIKEAIGYLTPGGVFAFQTAEYDPKSCNRDWWYIGPANGHISLYSRAAFDSLANQLNIKERLVWNNYPGLQAWRVGYLDDDN